MLNLPKPTGSTPNADLINAIYCLFSDNITCINTWGFYLFSSEFDKEPELRNKIGVIWVVSLLDSLEGERRALEDYETEAILRGLPHLVDVCKQASRFFRIVEEVLSLYTKEEQIFLNDLRNQFVHSWLARRHVKEFQITYYDGTSMVRERITQEYFNSVVQPFYMARSLDKTLRTLISRFMARKLRYWGAIEEIKRSLPLLQEAMVKDQIFVFASLSV
jgi:hypothetical protein